MCQALCTLYFYKRYFIYARPALWNRYYYYSSLQMRKLRLREKGVRAVSAAVVGGKQQVGHTSTVVSIPHPLLLFESSSSLHTTPKR